MAFKNPFAAYDDKLEESFGDFAYLDHPEPSFVREDFDPNEFIDRRASNETTGSEQTAVVVPSLVTLARAYMWDRLPGGYAFYNDQDSSGDIESFNNEKRTWRPLNIDDDPSPMRPQRGRSDSVSSCRTDAPDLDEDDPRITGIPPNNHDVMAWRRAFEEEQGAKPTAVDEANFFKQQSAPHHVFSRIVAVSLILVLTLVAGSAKRHCLLRLGKAFIRFGAPTHRLEGIMKAARQALDLREVHFVVLPSLMLVSFGDGLTGSTDMRLVKTKAALDLGRLSETYKIYKDLTHSVVGASEAADRLGDLLRPESMPFWSNRFRCFFGFATAFLVCPMAFGGSLLDAVIAGSFGAFVSGLSLYASSSSSVFSTLYEVFAVIAVSFASQALSRIDNEKWVCYSAVSTAGVVSLLPGFLVLSSSQEIAAKHAMSGSIKMVYAIVYSLFLGFSLSFGSQLWLLWDRAEARLQNQAIAWLNPDTVTGAFTRLAGEDTIPWPTGAFNFVNQTGAAIEPIHNHFITDACIRTAGAPFYLQSWSWKFLFVLVPVYTLCSAFRNLQPLTKKRQDLKQIIAMVFISSSSYAANRASSTYFSKSDSVTAIGAIVVGLLGNMYSRIFKGYAYPAMVPGVLFLIPSGISSVEGEAYTGQNITLRILQVSVGVTVGLGLSNYVVYNAAAILPKRFGGRRSKKEAVFAF